MSLCAAQLVDASETAVQTSDVSGMLVHVSGVSDSGVHFRVADTLMPEVHSIAVRPNCTLVAEIDTLDSAAIRTDWFTTTLVLTVISAHASITMFISGTLTALTVIALSSLMAKLAVK